ncbi:glycoside hydrolase family 2 protein [Paenibacillus elgii]|uniref:glycoside hydrolase family 2 protein n=1 Tax=Paenibacillus elgii TaxID=189691 RepID=UPI00204069EA|nr:sugar-binding domain-containing protein [Paenibacillus elgii]MCM3269656.1 glycoside hydrolase family 2 [Paenibacillus elgii]
MQQQPRPEYPRPQFVREEWLNLNGTWEFAFDDSGSGDREKWYIPGNGSEETVFSHRITVPFCFQSTLSCISDTSIHDTVWYRKKVTLPHSFSDKRVLLHFGAVDYRASVWINGQLAMTHEGGHVPFGGDITDLLQEDENCIVVKAEDFSRDKRLPRGKQFWEDESRMIWYTRTTGIWQTVWMEAVATTHLDRLWLTPDIDRDEIQLRIGIKGRKDRNEVSVKAVITFGGEHVTTEMFQINHDLESRSIGLNDFHDHGMGRLWSPETPNLYDVEFIVLVDGVETDRVKSYFGMRKISIEHGKICLNNRPIVMKMVLDQGYFPDGILTAPTDEALRQDVELTKAMGFNGSRKHQKVEDPRFLYWCDKLGLLVWGEMANAYDYSVEYAQRFAQEWQEAVVRDYNHPCIVAWVPLNESWGVPNILIDRRQQHHAHAMYYLTKSIDEHRPVISNDGWEHMKSDLCTIHDYEWREEVLTERYSTIRSAAQSMPANRRIHVGGMSYADEPILLSEFGGISFRKSDWEGWGYSGATDEEDFLKRLTAVVRPALHSPVLQGFCYTQLTDVEQEINGLLTYDRVPKVPLEQIRAIVEGNAWTK